MIKIVFFAFLSVLTGTLNPNSLLKYSIDITEEEKVHPYVEIRNNIDVSLQASLESVIRKNKNWQRLVDKKLMSVGLVDLQNENSTRYAAINGKHMMYAASLPKIAVLLAAVEEIERGCLTLDKALDYDLRQMIAKSNNRATTRVIERLGFTTISEVLESDKYRFYNRKTNGGLWVGKKYAKAGKKYPDPLKGLSHAASVEQVCRFYNMLAHGKLVSEKGNELIMKYMVNPEINHKFVNTLNKIAPDAQIYRKSGSWRNYHSDSALVVDSNGRSYVLVALIQSPNGSQICKDLVYAAERALQIGKPELAPGIRTM